MSLFNINFTYNFIDLSIFTNQFNNDMDIYLIMIIALGLLAIGDLVVGVSNDAVNFLNSALGSKALSVRNIMILASLGVAVGAIFSSGMMEVARKGIFNPDMFFFSEIMIIFMAVMITDILLLDFFNTLGMPTSTTVSIVFELLGAAVAVSLIKIFAGGGSFGDLVEYINVAKAKSFFLKKFKNKIKFNKDIKIIKNKNNKTLIDNKSYDFIINTTWQQFKPSNKWDLSYELCISLLYKSKKNISNAITIMDGPFLTLYPWSKTKFNLYSVKYSRYLKSKNFHNLKHKINKIKRKDFLKIKQLMENEFIKYLPDFRKKYRFLKYISTFRTLIEKKNDSRDYQIEFKNNVFNILSGKVDHIFLASKDIKKCIKNFS